MGYDIYSMREDREKSHEYAKKHTPWVLEENGELPDYWRNTAYYRMNIWGMGVLRALNEKLGVEFLNEALWDNSGTVIRDWECEDAAEKLAAKDDLEIRAAVIEVVKDEPELNNDEQIGLWVQEVRAWQEYLSICANLKGCEVL